MYTQTVVVAGPNRTTVSGNAGGGGSFFHNTGAIAGVFTVVGIAAAAIFVYLLLGILRRRKRMKDSEKGELSFGSPHGSNPIRRPLDGEVDDELSPDPFRSTHSIPRIEHLGGRGGGVGLIIDDLPHQNPGQAAPALEGGLYDPYNRYHQERVATTRTQEQDAFKGTIVGAAALEADHSRIRRTSASTRSGAGSSRRPSGRGTGLRPPRDRVDPLPAPVPSGDQGGSFGRLGEDEGEFDGAVVVPNRYRHGHTPLPQNDEENDDHDDDDDGSSVVSYYLPESEADQPFTVPVANGVDVDQRMNPVAVMSKHSVPDYSMLLNNSGGGSGSGGGGSGSGGNRLNSSGSGGSGEGERRRSSSLISLSDGEDYSRRVLGSAI